MSQRGNYLRRTLARVLAGALVAGASAVAVAPAAPAQAAGPNLWGFAFMNNGALPAAMEASSSGLGAAVAHPGQGVYQITFNGIGTPPGASPGVVHVTAAPFKGAVWCQADNWAPAAGNEVINVLCFQSPGAVPVNTNFSVTFSSVTPPAPGPPYGYLESNGGPGTVTQFDSAGGLITSTPAARGSWVVIMPGLGGMGPAMGGIQVTTAGAHPGHCKVSAWRTTAGQQGIRVLCFTPAGVTANFPWTLTYQGGTDIVGNTPPDFGYVWHAGAAPRGTNFNSCGAVNIVRPPAPFKITFPCIFAPMNDVQLSASGPNSDFCSLSSPAPWAANGRAVIVPKVKCFHVTGALSVVDDFFATYTAS